MGMETKNYPDYSDGIEIESSGWFYLLKCDCGKRFECLAKSWPGKRVIQDCGCGRAAQTEPKAQILLCLPSSMAAKAKQAARKSNMNLSQWTRDQIQRGIDKHELQSKKG
jgi:hypothetical protein